MAKNLDVDKLDRVIDAGLSSFGRAGFRSSSMKAIADEAGVAPGTLYLYVGGKDALFHLAVHRAFGGGPPPLARLPFEGRVDGALVQDLRSLLMEGSDLPLLRAAAVRRVANDPRAEFVAIVGELWNWSARYGRSIGWLRRWAHEWPNIELTFYNEVVHGILELGAAYLARRMLQGALRSYPDPDSAIHALVESVLLVAGRDAGSTGIEPSGSNDEDTVRLMLHRSFLFEPA